MWYPPPVCTTVNCTVPILNNGQYLTEAWVSANLLPYTYGTTFIIQCNTLYEITNGSNSITCQKDGTWSSSPPQCVKITCNDSCIHRQLPRTWSWRKWKRVLQLDILYITEGSPAVICTESSKFTWTSQQKFGMVSYIFLINGFG